MQYLIVLITALILSGCTSGDKLMLLDIAKEYL